MTGLSLEQDIAKGLRRILPGFIPNSSIIDFKEQPKIEGSNVVPDFLVKSRVGKVEKTLLIEIKSRGEPRLLYEAVGQLSIMSKALPNAYPVVVIPSISPEGKAICKDAGVGYIALDGEMYFQFDSVLIDRQYRARTLEGKPVKVLEDILKKSGRPQKIRRIPFPFSPKASRVLRVLLENPKSLWTVFGLADAAKVAPRMAHLAINFLYDKALLTKERGAIKLEKPKELLDLWTAGYKFQGIQTSVGYYSLDRTFEEFLARLKKLPADRNDLYGLTMYAGASLVAPYLRFGVNHVYVIGDQKEWVELLGLRSVESGANTFLVTPYDENVLYGSREIKGARVVSSIQLYLDLYNFNDRAKEQAEVIRKEAIKF